MDAATLSALAALGGSAIGGLTSFCSTWLGQDAQTRAQLLLHDKGRKQELYRDFIEQASKAYISALTHDQPDISATVGLYALISRMRVMSSPLVSREAERLARVIVATYIQPNKTPEELRALVDHRTFDPLHDFSELCREELQEMR